MLQRLWKLIVGFTFVYLGYLVVTLFSLFWVDKDELIYHTPFWIIIIPILGIVIILSYNYGSIVVFAFNSLFNGAEERQKYRYEHRLIGFQEVINIIDSTLEKIKQTDKGSLGIFGLEENTTFELKYLRYRIRKLMKKLEKELTNELQ